MAKYDITFSCGHTGRVDLIGKTSDRNRKIEWFESCGLCSECYEAEKQRQFDEQNKKAAEEAAEMDLPELTGSEKQVAWANTLRKHWMDIADQKIDQAKKTIERFKDTHPDKVAEAEENLPILIEAIDRILKTKTEAGYWIDGREDNVSSTILKLAEKIKVEQDQTKVPKAVEQEALEDMTMRPSEPVTPLVTEIRIKEDAITVKLPEKDEDFRKIVKDLKYSWGNGCWQRKISESTGLALDRAAELGIRLLAAGFPIRVYDDVLQQQILSGEYEPECDRWIYIHDAGFRVKWWNRDEDFYKEAKRLPGSHWISEKRSMYIPSEAFRDLQGFADRYQFKFSEKAQEKLLEAARAFESALIADVKVPISEHLTQPGSIPKLKPEEGSIDESLRDEN